MSRSSRSSMREMVSVIQEMARKQMKRARKDETERATEQVMERVMKRVMEPLLEPMIKRLLKQVMKKEKNRAKKRAMEQMMKLAKKPVMEPTLSTQDVSADLNQRTPPDRQIQKLEVREFQLLFANKLPKTFYTKGKITDVNGGNVEIKLIDTISKETVEEGPLSLIDIDIEILNSDLGSEGHENWTEQDFDAKIVHPGPNKGPLVEGKQNITFRNGVGTIDDLSFSDNSSWKKFRLGARVAGALQRSRMGQPRIKEAISEPFAVKDHHKKMSKKQDLPDDAHKIEKINLDLALRPPTSEAEPYISPTTGPLLQEMQNANNHASFQLNLYGDCPSLPSLNDPAEVELHNNPATDPQPRQFPIADHHGSAGMQNASQSGSSQSNELGLSLSLDSQRLLIESFQINPGPQSIFQTVQHLASKPLVMSTSSHVNVQPLCNSDSGSSFHPPRQLYGDHTSLPSLNDPAEVELHNNRATDPQPPQFPNTDHQGSVGMQNANNNVSSSHHKSGLSPENVQNSASQPLAPLSVVDVHLTLSNDSHSGSSQLNGLGLSHSSDTQFWIECLQTNNGPASQISQNTVMSPDSSFFNLWNLSP